MKPIHFLAVGFLAMSSLGTIAQELTIDGQAIPEGQTSAIEAHCFDLLAQQGATGTQEPETTMAEAPETTNAQAPVSGELDVKAITLEQCSEGGFTELITNSAG